MRFWLALGLLLLLASGVSCTPEQQPFGNPWSSGALAPGEAAAAPLGTREPTKAPTMPAEDPLTDQSRHTPTAEAARPTPSATPLPPALCSPLEMHPLEDLVEIVGDPYKPPRPGREERHHGVDFAYYHYGDRDTMQGEPVQSVFPGVVVSVLNDLYPYGNMVMIETALEGLSPGMLGRLDMLEPEPDDSLYVLYAHLDGAPLVSLGDSVGFCQLLGEVGLSGNTDIPHLHLEMRLGPAGSVFESMRYYDTRATIAELETYELWRTSGVFRHFDPMLLLTP